MFGLLGLLANRGRVITFGWVWGSSSVTSLLARLVVSESAEMADSSGDGRNKVGNVGRTDSGLPDTSRTGVSFLSWVPELPVLSLLGC